MTDLNAVGTGSRGQGAVGGDWMQVLFWGSRARVFGAIAFLACLNFVLLKSDLLGDPDTHWHVAIGRWIVENGGWPHVDVFSHTATGQPWIAKEWLSQVALYAAHHVAGWTGVALLGVVSFAASVALLTVWLSRGLKGTAVCLAMMLAVLLASNSLLARPHLVALPLMLIWTLGMLDAVARKEPPHWLLLPIMLAWSNAHAGYTIGFVIAGLLAMEAVRDAGDGRRGRLAARWALFLGLAVVASCTTPYGYEAVLVTQKLFAGSGREALAYVDEWRPIEFELRGVIGMVMVLALLGGLALQPLRNIVRIALVLILGWMMIRHVRFGLLFAFTAVPIAMSAIMAGPLARWIGPERSSPGRARPTIALMLAAMATISALWLASTVTISPRTTPAAALDAAHKLGLTRLKVFNTYGFGGYLISKGVPTFIDGRTDQLFLDGFVHTYVRTKSPEGLAEFGVHLERHDVGWALVQSDSGHEQNLISLGWTILHRDTVATVLAPPAGQPGAI
jgi:hypothetical protein